MIRVRAAGVEDRPRLLAIWCAAVDATHHFLTPEDRAAIEVLVATEYLPAAELLVAEREGAIVGFAGASGRHVDALFVDPQAHGRGVGRALMAAAGAESVDVNEQNPGAIAFYRALGFAVAGRSEQDDGGRPYPILHLRRDAARSA